jgi:hypothetical protein
MDVNKDRFALWCKILRVIGLPALPVGDSPVI